MGNKILDYLGSSPRKSFGDNANARAFVFTWYSYNHGSAVFVVNMELLNLFDVFIGK